MHRNSLMQGSVAELSHDAILAQETVDPPPQAAQDCTQAVTQAADESLARSTAYHKKNLEVNQAALALFNSTSANGAGATIRVDTRKCLELASVLQSALGQHVRVTLSRLGSRPGMG
jgi:hypothetical protein